MKSQTVKATEKFSTAIAPDYEAKIRRALEIQATMEPLKEELEGIKQYFKDVLGDTDKTENKCITPSGTATYKLSNSYSVAPEWIPQLKSIFKKEYNVFVNEKPSYGCTAALKTLLANADYENIETIREAVVIKQSPSVSFEPTAELKRKK